MRIFWISSFLLFAVGLGWLVFAHPVEAPSLTVAGDRAYYAQGSSVKVFGSAGILSGEWKAPRPIRQMLSDGMRLGLVYEGEDDLHLFSPLGEEEEILSPPQKAEGRGRWARLGSFWVFLHPSRQTLFVRAQEETKWRALLSPEDEPAKPVDVSGYIDAHGELRGVAVLCEEPPVLYGFTFDGLLKEEMELTGRTVPSVRYFIFERNVDFLKPQRAVLPWRVQFAPGGRGVALFRTSDDRYRRLVSFRREAGDWKTRGVYLPSIPRHRKTETRTPQEIAWMGEGFLMAGREGGLWYYREEKLPPGKPWIEPPPATKWEKVSHQRAWGWAGWVLAILSAWVAVNTKGKKVAVPREAALRFAASLVIPGWGQALEGRRGWASFWFLSVLFGGEPWRFFFTSSKREIE